MIDTNEFYNELNSIGIDFFTGVPDSLLANLCSCISANSKKEKNIIAANEGNAVAIAAGHYLSTGEIGVVYMQNSGEGNAVNPLLSLADEDVYSIPMLLIIGWRGEPNHHDEPQHVKQGKVTMSLLDAMGISYAILSDDYAADLKAANDYMKKYSRPYALIVRKNTFSPFKNKVELTDYPLLREEALNVVLSNIEDDDFVVSTTGKTSREIFEIRNDKKQGHSNDFLTVGSMGHTASIAFGVALGTRKRVWCIDGDGSFIMHMGGLGVICANMPDNFKYIINDNNAHESVGGQPTCSNSLDIPKVLCGLGFNRVIEARTADEIVAAIKELKDNSSVALVLHTRQGSRENLGRPTTTPQENKIALMKKLGSMN